jgi:cyanophycinase
MELSEARGRLVAIGGAEDKEGDCRILKEVVKMARGPRARIVVMTVATNHPEEVGREYRAVFNRLGVDDVRVVDVSSRADTTDAKAVEAIKEATCLFFTGGDQLHVTSLIGGTEMQALIHRRYEKGLLIAGTSAGAAMMSNSMIVSGDSKENPRFECVHLGPGMDLLIGAVIDTHFSQRGRFGRLLTATAHYPQDMGLGIDEDTAMVVNRGEFEVIGSGAVTVVDAGAMTYTSLPYAERHGSLALYNVRVHVLSEGHRFNLAAREPVVQEQAPKRNGNSDSGKRPAKKAKAKA